ncbi:MAG: HAMP domain-containing histidine kinase [Odoribacteraceae bacterium]|jgi:two-component system phosphate regulon sensor histidine kinase PhoR|nr:HAMP domain-containing histidine kinase [Odoribacteraceae bacterium]
MIRRTLIRILSIFMLIAFIAVVSVQWIWIRSSMKEREDRFRSKVYSVLNQTVSFIDDMDNKRILGEMKKEIREDLRNALDTARASDTAQEPTGEEPVINFFNRHGAYSNAIIRGEYNIFEFQLITGNTTGSNDRYLDSHLLEWLGHYLGVDTPDETGLALPTNDQRYEVARNLLVGLVNEKEGKEEKVQRLLADKNIDLKTFMREKFGNNDIRIPFTVELTSEKEMLGRIAGGKSKGFYYEKVFPKVESANNEFYLGVTFDSTDSLDSLIYENMLWMYIISAFCIIGLMTVFIATIIVITRQQKLSVIKNDFINNMTHEFKTPLATISLATAAIEKEKVLSDKAQLLKFNAMIRSENERMDKYVERILIQAKLDRREVHLKKTMVDLNLLVSDAVQHFRLQVENAGGEMQQELAPGGLLLQVDEVHVFNAVCNLIDNAIKYSPTDIKIFVFTRWENGNFVIGVQDHGIGIAKEAQHKVFKRFYRVPSGNVHNVKGFGLGLSYVKSIVLLHGGDIRLTSKKGKGTLVEIIFKPDKEE